MPNSFPCPACGAPVEPAPNKTLMTCPFCGTSLTIPVDLRWNQFTAPELPPATPGGKPIFDPFKAAENARFSGKKAEKAQAETEFVTNALRRAQPIAAGAVSAYALWTSLRRFLPGCLVAVVILCALSCGASIFLLFFIGRGN